MKFLLFLGNRPPGMVPNKFHYMTKDLERASGYFAIPLYPPSNVFEAMFEKGIQTMTRCTMQAILADFFSVI